MTEWISVKDRLPEHWKACILVKGNVYNFAFWDCDDNKWVSDRGRFNAEDATHWMLLPEPPKQ